jgi:nucleotide-binding universal stress UspA family protein
MKRVLVAVDAAADTAAVVAEVARMQSQEPISVHLLNVQPAVSGHVAMFFDDTELHELQQAAGEEVLAPVRAQLGNLRVPCSSSVRIGRCAETIARTAQERGCDRIVLGHERTAARLASKVFGSVAEQVRQLLRGGRDCQVIGA